jgi:23S rRNA (guanosine2251-2'-O)-methyltransferase
VNVAGGKKGGQGGRGAKPGSHRKGAAVGSGGHRKRALEGRGPTPPAQERTGHPAARRAQRAAVPGAQRAAVPGAKRAAVPGAKRAAVPGAKRAAVPGAKRGGAPAAASKRPGSSPSRRPAAHSRPDQSGPEIIAGRNPVVEALRAHVPASALYVATGIELDERVRETIKLAKAQRVPLLEADRREIDRYAPGAVHQGLVLQVPPFSYLHPDEVLDRAFSAGVPLVVALDGVTDPRNLGAVVRSVAAFGGHGVVVPERRSAGMTASAWKASAGAAARVPVARATNLTRALAGFAARGLLVVGLAADGELDLHDLEVATDPLVVVAGSEGKGLSRLVRERCDLVVRIPIAAATESLNASVAASVALYEVARRRAAALRS